MTIEIVLGAIGVAFSVGGLITLFTSREERTKFKIILGVVLVILFVTSGLVVYLDHLHQRHVNSIEGEIIETIGHEELTFHMIYEKLGFLPFSDVNEALTHAVQTGKIGYNLEEFQRNGGDLICTRLYYVK